MDESPLAMKDESSKSLDQPASQLTNYPLQLHPLTSQSRETKRKDRYNQPTATSTEAVKKQWRRCNSLILQLLSVAFKGPTQSLGHHPIFHPKL